MSFLEPSEVASDFQGLDADSHDCSRRSQRGVDALGVSTVQDAHAVCGKVAARDAAFAYEHLRLHC